MGEREGREGGWKGEGGKPEERVRLRKRGEGRRRKWREEEVR